MPPMDRNSPLLAQIAASRGGDLLRFIRRRVGNDADAYEIAQESYLRFMRLPAVELVRNPEAYLFRIASNMLHEYALRRRQQAAVEARADEPSSGESGFEVVVSREQAARLDAVLNKLPANRRAALILHLRNDMSCAEIAQAMGVSVPMVKKHLAAALAYCRKRLKDHKP
jgi:RNA polymerase sigma factor (sigma-70 family)